MRTVSAPLRSYLDGICANGGATLMADCYTFTLQSGPVLRYSSLDVAVTVEGNTFLANSVRVSGLQFTSKLGLDADSQQVVIFIKPTDMVGTIPFLVAMRAGLFDLCGITRDRAFFAPLPAGTAASYAAPAIGSVNLFTGRLSTIDALGRTAAKVTVVSLLTMLDVDSPHNFYQPNCNHALFDAGCGLAKTSYATAGKVGAGSTASLINWGNASSTYTQGTLTMTSGVLSGLSASIKQAATGVLGLMFPFEAAPAVGDTFDAYPGCDHTLGANGCGRFANKANFRGFPYVPPATSTYANNGG